jgi:hypothetical protein
MSDGVSAGLGKLSNGFVNARSWGLRGLRTTRCRLVGRLRRRQREGSKRTKNLQHGAATIGLARHVIESGAARGQLH